MSRISFILVFLLPLTACGSGGNGSMSAQPVQPVSTVTPVHDIQGSGSSSPFDGQRVTIEGIVTGDFQDGDGDESRNLFGFFMQEEMPDGDSATSDGIFVFDGNAQFVDVTIGQKVQVDGTVNERFGETQISAHTITVLGSGSVQAVDLVLPGATTLNSDGQVIADLERFEGMLVQLTAPLFVSDTFNLERYGELTLSAGDRLRQFTNTKPPDVAGYAAHRQDNAARSIILDDGSSIRNPAEYSYLSPTATNAADYSVRAGDTVVVAAGNIRFSRGSGGSGVEAYRLEPTIEPLFVSQNLRVDTPPVIGGSITVASFNVLNYFTTIDSGQRTCGPSGDAGCRGADSDSEFNRQHTKTINTLLALDADVVGLMELENNGGVALQSIVNGLNAIAGADAWNYIDTGVIATDAITVGLIYRTSAVQPAGPFAILTSAVDARFNDRKNRPVLAQTFDSLANGGRFTVAVNHLKSKGSDCDDVGDPNRNDGQGNCNVTRTRAAEALADWLAGDPTSSNDADVLIIGDLNAYLREDPILALESAGYVNLLDSIVGSDAYSFVFAGQAGALDHAFASAALSARVTGVAEWHINADEPPLIDYNLEFNRDAAIFDENVPFRASDHDPIIVGINP